MEQMKANSRKHELEALSCIQTLIKSSIGIGRHLPIQFRIKLDNQQEIKRQRHSGFATTNITYNYREIGS